MTSQAASLVIKPVAPGRDDRIALLSLSRPEAANAFNDALMRECIAHLAAVAAMPNVRALVLRGKGKHFSAGADLGWMKESAKLSYDANLEDAGNLTRLFESLASLQVPTLAVVTGSTFGGAVGLTACCDVAVALDGARFALSEVKLGLAPAVIMPYLARKIRPGALRRLALTGLVFDAREARDVGLVERVAATEDELRSIVRDELSAILAGSPKAQTATKALLDHVTQDGFRQSRRTAETIAGLRTSPAGQAGLGAFFEKKAPPWSVTLAPDWRYDEDAP